MKRFFTSFIAALAFICTASAQQSATNYENFYSMRLGINFSSLISEDYSTDSQSGFNAAALYNISLMQSAPLYLQSGIGIGMKGARNTMFIDTDETTHLKSYNISIPVVLTYDIAINNTMSILPEFGLYYSYAFAGSLDGGGEFYRPYEKLGIIAPDGEIYDTELFHRSDFGIRAGISLRIMRCMVGFAYEAGMINCFSKDLRDAGLQVNTGCWSVNLGYQFN